MEPNEIEYKIKTATEDDILAHLQKCTTNFSPPLNERVNIKEYSQKIFAKAMTFEAWKDHFLVGLIAAYLNKNSGLSVYITDVSVMKDYMGLGIASTLLRECIEYARKENNKEIKRVSTSAINMLMSYHWPGNVRELENIIERAVILSEDKVIHGYHLPPTLQTAHFSHTKHTYNLQHRLDALEYDLIIESLKNHKGNMVKSAKELGLTTRIMSLRVKKYTLNPKIYKRPN